MQLRVRVRAGLAFLFTEGKQS